MRLVHHVLLTSAGIPEHLAAEQAKISQLNPLSNVSQETFQTDNAINIEDEEGMLLSHVIKAFLHSIHLLVTEETDTKRIQRSLRRELGVILIILIFGWRVSL